MSEVKIEKNIPVPPNATEGARKFPFNKMEIGDSFLLNGQVTPERMANSAYAYGKAHHKKFSVRKTPEGHRCWRIA